ncbi:MAG: FAD binding domain-containing protein [Thermodesulfobacteriota bacterium]
MHHFDYHTPQSLDQAFELMAESRGKARYIAGGSDLMPRIKQRVLHPDVLISLRGIEELQGIALDEDFLTIKAATLLRDIETSPEVLRAAPALQQAVHLLANVQVRNVGTLGGNLANASPAADSPPPLLVHAAQLILAGPEGERSVDLEDFFLGPGQTCLQEDEIIKEVRIPGKHLQGKTAFLKIGRTAKDLALVNAAVRIEMQGRVCSFCRLATGAVAPVPLRLKPVEDFVTGRELTDSVLARVRAMVRDEVSPISDQRASKDYRRELSGTLIKRGIEQAMG